MTSLPTPGDTRQPWIALLHEAASGNLQPLEALLEADEEAHAPLLRLLTQLDFSPEQASLHWRGILTRHRELAARLEHAPSLQLAALDYFQRIAPELRNPKLVEMSIFLETERNAITDGLTGLFNRQFFDQSLRRELKRARRYGLTFSLVLIDLDDFKALNDRFGHVVGDEALSVCSHVIQASVREIDVACRYGGEEFAIILPETSRTGAYIVSERIRADVKGMNLSEAVHTERPPSNGISLSVSGGIALYPTDSNTEEGLIRMADQALYRSKHDGKNRITLHAQEKRRSPRLDARKHLVFRERMHEQHALGGLESETKNLSRNGALLESEIPLDVGTELEIDIHLPQERAHFLLRGRVVRLESAAEEPGTDQRYELGVAFVADTDEEVKKLEVLAAEIYRPLETHSPHP